MLYSIYRGNLEGRTEDQVIYLRTTVEVIRNAGLEFVFTDGHGIMRTTEFFEDLDRLDRVDWPLMTAMFWNSTQEDPDRSRRRQAEFLVHRFLPWDAIGAVIVHDTTMEAHVTEVLSAAEPKSACPVVVRRSWYYS